MEQSLCRCGIRFTLTWLNSEREKAYKPKKKKRPCQTCQNYTRSNYGSCSKCEWISGSRLNEYYTNLGVKPRGGGVNWLEGLPQCHLQISQYCTKAWQPPAPGQQFVPWGGIVSESSRNIYDLHPLEKQGVCHAGRMRVPSSNLA